MLDASASSAAAIPTFGPVPVFDDEEAKGRPCSASPSAATSSLRFGSGTSAEQSPSLQVGSCMAVLPRVLLLHVRVGCCCG